MFFHVMKTHKIGENTCHQVQTLYSDPKNRTEMEGTEPELNLHKYPYRSYTTILEEPEPNPNKTGN